MWIRLQCPNPNCHRMLKVASEFAGTTQTCPACKQAVHVPLAEALPLIEPVTANHATHPPVPAVAAMSGAQLAASLREQRQPAPPRWPALDVRAWFANGRQRIKLLKLHREIDGLEAAVDAHLCDAATGWLEANPQDLLQQKIHQLHSTRDEVLAAIGRELYSRGQLEEDAARKVANLQSLLEKRRHDLAQLDAASDSAGLHAAGRQPAQVDVGRAVNAAKETRGMEQVVFSPAEPPRRFETRDAAILAAVWDQAERADEWENFVPLELDQILDQISLEITGRR